MKTNIKLYCPICGGDLFEVIDEIQEELKDAPDNTRVKCSNCKNIQTKLEIIEGNQYIINSNLEQMKSELVDEAIKKIKKSLRSFKK